MEAGRPFSPEAGMWDETETGGWRGGREVGCPCALLVELTGLQAGLHEGPSSLFKQL